MIDEDRRDLCINAALDQLAFDIQRANGFSRAEVMARFAAFAENDDLAPVTPVAPIDLRAPARKRPARRQQVEARA